MVMVVAVAAGTDAALLLALSSLPAIFFPAAEVKKAEILRCGGGAVVFAADGEPLLRCCCDGGGWIASPTFDVKYGGGSPRHGSRRRLASYQSSSALRMKTTSAGLKSWKLSSVCAMKSTRKLGLSMPDINGSAARPVGGSVAAARLASVRRGLRGLRLDSVDHCTLLLNLQTNLSILQPQLLQYLHTEV